VLVGRTLERLELVATDIRANGGKARVAVADVTNEDEVTALFNTLEAPETLELVAYNVGSNVMVPSLEMHAADFEDMWRQNALGGFLIGRQAIRTMLPCKRGSVIYTGAS
jgi:NADP-dependent 3-hydroxy acid dehydrogenase YdfG